MELLRYFYPKDYTKQELYNLINKHDEIKYISLLAIDLGSNRTDAKIPVWVFKKDFEEFIEKGIQTDGSSVNLPLIATINNARVDIIPDMNAKWTVDYNYSLSFGEENKPVGTLHIPSFLKHNDKFSDSRSILDKSVKRFKSQMLEMLKNQEVLDRYGIKSFDEIKDVEISAATELEFWVQSPEEISDPDKLLSIKLLKEQYWKKTSGVVRTALEHTLSTMEEYGFEPIKGRKLTDGVKFASTAQSKNNYVMEQLGIDWRYKDPLQCADNELIVKDIITDVFSRYNLNVLFDAKPIENTIGSGEHHHIGVGVVLKDKTYINLFAPKDMKKDFMSAIGYGALMGALHNYEAINPFVTASYDAFNRLEPGFQAPVCIVASLGIEPDIATINRSVLVGLVRDFDKPNGIRLEFRGPTPNTNSYLTIAAILQAMLDGIEYAIDKKSDDLFNELNKKQGDKYPYLEENRRYLSEEDVYKVFSDKMRNVIFGKTPNDVYQVFSIMEEHPNKIAVLTKGDVFTKDIIASYKDVAINRWIRELTTRIIVQNMATVRSYVKKHSDDFKEASESDLRRWQNVHKLKWQLMKHDDLRDGLFDRLRFAIDTNDYEKVSEIQIIINMKMHELKDLYEEYTDKLFN